ncbi:MAG: GNAT family N-acetyltransferase [Oscillospiraceae bacterium]|jgi:ribosomal protein S18 acetylase RimI-like enzyme|nr:GNAT family N-acetyltransferase [Oscillospiraceae bacterium]
MQLTVAPYAPSDLTACTEIWNDILDDGISFPGTELLSESDMARYLAEQSAVTCVSSGGVICGFYILHPNNIGRCSHVANATYCVSKNFRGRGVGRQLVPASLAEAKSLGFRGIQFNAVVAGNVAAVTLYKNNGFNIVGTIPGGFRLKDGTYSDMYIMYRDL